MRYRLAGLARGLHAVATTAPDQRVVVSDRQRFAQEISLHRVAADVGQKCQLLLGFHTLRYDGHFEPVAETNDGPDDRGRLRVASEIDDERAVDLDLVERKRLQIAQGGIAATEVVHGYPNAKRLKPPQQREATIEIVDQHALGDLQFEPARRESGLEQDRMHETDDIAVHELRR